MAKSKDFLQTSGLFFKALFFNPRAMGAVVPSSHYLAEKMADCIDTTKPGFVLELGPGTGVVTEAILNAGVSAAKLIALEVNSDFASPLRNRFPDISVIEGNATHLSALLKDKSVDTIISSLPLLSLSSDDREKIFKEIQKILSPNGRLIQFTYSRKTKDHFFPDNFVLTHSFTVWRNIPPARVMVFHL
ncbi:MAG: methyltransferase domain-containing protein [Gammaproteobacteria bacterium]|nr:methyltransferase domain-containing protein [Gammaproteobacteria bacterium]